MKRVKRLLALALAAMMLLCAGCGNQVEEKGLEIRASFVETPATLDPAYATTDEERTIVVHLFENLMKFTAAGLVNGQAASYEVTVNEDGTETYSFTLRNDIRWSDGKAVTAEDFVHAWQRLVSPRVDSPNREILKMVAGYEGAVNGDLTSLQVSAPDSRTFVVTLSGHCPYFLPVVCTDSATMPVRADVVQPWMSVEESDDDGEEDTAAAVPDWTMKKATLIANGAYAVRNFNAGHLTVVEAEGYYDSRRLGPKEIDFFFAESIERAISSYDKDESAFILKCGDLEGSVTAQQPEVMVLVVNQMSSLSESVRQAMTLSLDRNLVAAAAGATFCGAEGLVPQGVATTSGAMFRQVNGPVTLCDEASVEKNRASARELMTSFYRGGAFAVEHLGVVSLIYESGAVNARIVQQVKQQWQEVLGITVELVAVESEEMQKALESGAFSIALMSVSDATNTASGYLEDYVGGSRDNYGQHYSNAYDILLRAADNSDSVEARDAYLADAERLLLESGYVIPLCNSTYQYLFRPTLTGLLQQDMGVYNFSAVTEIPVA
ncbi:MAG: peptide ABC transporter substrate-binding protein [Oscillospiraceae bacterium]|nr:peptide ABC transporter substrate-binding protein [Oscillospiraceae bacterium]